ncbi:carboxylesterase/lipase family protein [Marinactinospora rubrisoli]|uniref:Carboxylic ester hydrolase n=1 Tax=Marinactinospora rubrisoli TaxID=2715399 RepID=A0ABW2KP69_9ACTN
MSEIVLTTGGHVRGSRASEAVVAFLGIPYASAPFGPHRFREPGPPRPWRGVRRADEFGPIPPQPTEPDLPPWSPEDGECVLTVNVWAPPCRAPARPVLVWVHGGAYRTGFSADPLYDGTRLAEQGLVVVSLNYRVGFEGFGHVPGAPDNRGLLDQVAALRWVARNIGAFGGDPTNVTLAGESSGGGSVACLLAMPAARGLFQRAIAHSVPYDFVTRATAAAVGERVAEAAGAAPEALAEVPPGELVAAAERVTAEEQAGPPDTLRHYTTTVFAPVVDGEVLPAAPLTALEAGAGGAAELLLCHTLHEFRLFPGVGAAPQVTEDDALPDVARAFGLPPERVAGYRALAPGASAYDLYTMIATDGRYAEYTARLAEAHTRAGGRAHLARFAWESPALDGALGACHSLDVPFAFRNLDGGPYAEFLLGEPGPAEHALAGRIAGAWADFAATGDPGWPALSAGDTPVRTWNRRDGLEHDDPQSGTRALWRDVDFHAPTG